MSEPSSLGSGLLAAWRQILTLGLIVGTLTISWQFLRAWLALYLQDHRGYSRDTTLNLTTAYFVAADVGCLLTGTLVMGLTRRGWSVHTSRVAVFALFSLLTASAAIIPQVEPAEVVLLLLAGAGILGLHPLYYALAQELPAQRMGVLSGALAASGWIVSSIFQIVVGRHIQAEKSYAWGLTIVGLAPLLGLVALMVLWPAPPRLTSGSATTRTMPPAPPE